ncbi:oligosaccharide flippase family protein [Nanoarchaeota archaeon]
MKKSISQGVLYLGIAQMIFVITGYILNIALGRILGPASYGIFGVVTAINAAFIMALAPGVPGAVGKYISEEKIDAKLIQKRGLKIQMGFAAVLFMAYLAAAQPIAALLNDASLAHYLYATAFTIPFYAFYILRISYYNGSRQYGQQAKLAMVYPLAKLLIIVVLLLLGFRLWGAIIGIVAANVIASLSVFYIADKYLIKGEEGDISSKTLITFAYPLVLSSFVTTLVPYLDLLVVKYYLPGVTTGLYTAASAVSRAPSVILAALGLTIGPALSYSISNNKMKLTRTYIKEAIRYLMICLLPFIALIAATNRNLIVLFYSNVYEAAAVVLTVLIVAKSLGQFHNVFIIVINASGFTKFKLMISVFSLALLLGLNIILVPRYGMIGAAYAALLNTAIIAIASGSYVFYRFKPKFPGKSLVRITLASVAVYFIALFLDRGIYTLPLLYVGMGCFYLVLLILLKELKKKDYQRIKRMIPDKMMGYIPDRVWEVEKYFD